MSRGDTAQQWRSTAFQNGATVFIQGHCDC